VRGTLPLIPAARGNHKRAFPGRGAAQKRVYARERAIAGAPLIRGLSKLDAWVSEFVTIPGLQRIITLRCTLRCARDTR
jgi:hypothetical protein